VAVAAIGDRHMSHSFHDPETRPLANLDLLPPIARRKYGRLQQLISDAGALQKAVMERENGLEDRYNSLLRRQRLVDRKTEPDRVAEIERELREVGDELEQARAERNKRSSVRANCEQIVSLLKYNSFLSGDNVLRDAPNGFRPYGGPPAMPQAGETLEAAINRTRGAIGRLQGELAQVREAPPALSEIKEQITAQINKMASEGVPELTFKGDRVDLIFADQLQYAVPNAALSAPSGSGSKLLVWAFKDQILARLLKGTEQITGGITAADRARRIGELEQQIRELEHAEEALVSAGLEQGLDVNRRPNCHPFALLGLEAIPAQTATAQMVAAE
jgi:hypothetical protein